MNTILIAKYGEIFLKGQNRPFFEKTLLHNIRMALKGMDGIDIRKEVGRFYITSDVQTEDTIIDAIKNIFGITSISVACKIPSETEAIEQKLIEVAGNFINDMGNDRITFKLEIKRTNKLFPMSSPDAAKYFGKVLLDAYPDVLTVDVHNPQLTITVEIRDETFIIERNIKCLGGMPVSSSGKGLVLLSGGIDSPVAAYFAAKRGVDIEAIHFHSYPYTSDRAKEKVIDLLKALKPYCGRTRMFVVSLTEIQREIHAKCPEEYMTILTRRFMMKIADRVAKENNCKAIFTGESIGQVASQTLDGLAVTNNAVSLPVLRPLICMDKQEIVDIAVKIGTHDISILPFEDCCTVFQPKHPATKPQLDKVLAAESLLDCDALIENAMKTVEIYTN